MLATLAAPRSDVSMNEQRYPSIHDYTAPDPNQSMENRLCPGCKKSAVNEQGGLVVAFGQSFFHVDCFKCAKCGDQVTADTNLLLLSDGSPICANCSYSCNVCHLPILDEAIMTGDDSYHAHCFKCKVCKNRIDELVFAKTSQGIYCMNCHGERMAKIRRHAQKKAERAEKEKQKEKTPTTTNGSLGNSRIPPHSPPPGNSLAHARPPTPNSFMSVDQNGHPIPTHQAQLRTSPSSNFPRSSWKPGSIPYATDAFLTPNQSQPDSPTSPHHTHITLPSSSPSRSLVETSTVTSAGLPPHPPSTGSREPSPQSTNFHDGSSVDQNQLLPSAPQTSGEENLQQAPNFVNGVRSVNLLLPRDDSSIIGVENFQESSNTPGNLSIPGARTSRVNKRRSINPGMMFNLDTASLSKQTPTPPSPGSHGHSQAAGRDSPRVRSPLGGQFPDPPSSRPTSRTDSPHSPSTIVRFPTSSAGKVDNGSPSRQGTYDGAPKSARLAITVDVEAAGQPPSSEESLGMSVRRALRDGRSSDGSMIEVQRTLDGRLGEHSPERLRNSSSPTRSRSRQPSPVRRADVPRGVESGTDTEAESDTGYQFSETERPPVPPKQANASKRSSETGPNGSKRESGDNSDLDDFSPAEERMSHATFIAPALPPIRFSMNGSDFSELLGGTGANGSSARLLDQLAKVSEETELIISSEPSPVEPTPTIATTFPRFGSAKLPPNGNGEHELHSMWSQDSHHNHQSSLDLPSNQSILPKRSNTISARRPVKYDTSYTGVYRSRTLSADRERSSSQSSTKADSTSQSPLTTYVTLHEADSVIAARMDQGTFELLRRRLQEALSSAQERDVQQLRLDKSFVEAVVAIMDQQHTEYMALKTESDTMKRDSKQYFDGLSVAQTEYDQELKARHDAEAEVTRLRVLLSSQAVRLTAMSGENTRQERRQQMSKELSDTLDNLQRDIAQLRVERDMTLAEVEELTTSKSTARANNTEVPAVQLGRSLTMRLDNIKTQYQNELLPLTQQREALAREVAELKGVRDVFLEETTVLNARNEELARLSALYTRKIDAANPENVQVDISPPAKPPRSLDRPRLPHPPTAPSHSQSSHISSSSTVSEDTFETKVNRSLKPEPELPSIKPKFMKWAGSKAKELALSAVSMTDSGRAKPYREHSFQQLSVLRFTRCDHCGDKMWGSQLRCSNCSVAVHVRCSSNVSTSCSQQTATSRDDTLPMPPSMFGRDLADQVQADAHGGDRMVPVIVEKCIEAVEANAMDFEGLYRKTGGAGQSKAITQLFERGDYASFDLRDSDRFADICSVTSVLKTYFRSLPVPLLTYDLHENFIVAAEIKEPAAKGKALSELVKKLPSEHYYTLRMLMLHLSRVRDRSEKNLMNSRNLGVVFGPTLMRSPDPSAEFSDMAGKALSIEWLIENATNLFGTSIR